VHRRGLAPDVPRDKVELVHRNEKLVGGLATLAGGVLQYEVLAFRACDCATGHVRVATHPMLLVHDEISGSKGQRINGATAP
jgi:hypothetical protein